MISHDITFFETKFPSGKEFSHLHSANFRGDELRAMDDFVAPFVVASQVPAASSSVAKNVPPVIYDSITVEPPPTAKAFALRIHRVQRNTEPTSYHDAMMRLDAKKWLDAMHVELQALEDNRTWELCELPPGRRVIGTKWVCKIKVDALNILERYKARLVAQRFSQIADLDFTET